MSSVRACGHAPSSVEAVRSVHAVLHEPHEAHQACRRVAGEDPHFVPDEVGRVNVFSVRRDGHLTHGVKSARRVHALVEHLRLDEQAGRRVTTKHGQRIVVVTDGIDPCPIRTRRHAHHGLESLDSVDTVRQDLSRRKPARCGIAVEDHQRVVRRRDGIEMLSVRTETDRSDPP